MENVKTLKNTAYFNNTANLTGNLPTKRQNFVGIVFCGSELVIIDTFLAFFQKVVFGGHFEFLFKNVMRHFDLKLLTDFADFL